MCRRLVAAGLLALVAAGPMAAQELELQRRIDSLAPLVDQAAIEAEAARLAAQDAARLRSASGQELDTVFAARMRIVAPRSDAVEAQELFAEVWNEHFAGIESRSLSDRTFTYQRAAYDVDEIFVDGVRQQVVVPVWYHQQRVAARIRNAIGNAIAGDVTDSALGRWLHGNPFTTHDPARLYREAVLANSAAVERCLEGNVAACTASLGLELGDDALQVWYTPEQRRARVLAWAGYATPVGRGSTPPRIARLYGPGFERCARPGTPTACDVFMQSNLDVWAPLPLHARETLAGLAIERGGPGAWGRLVEDPDRSPGEALAYAADVPLEELVSIWRAWIVTNRPEAYAAMGGRSTLALLWILFFGALATRSTRWRSE